MMRPDLVSAILPAFNAERYLREAIDSVLAQRHYPIEVIVVDDGSTDGTRALAEGFGPPVRAICQHNTGPGGARNRGVEAARGAWLAFLDADDLWLPRKIERQLAALADEPEETAVFGRVQAFTERDGMVTEIGAASSGSAAGAMMIGRSAFDRVGAFRTDLCVGEFVDWYLRASATGIRMKTLPEVMLRRRIHGENLGVRMRAHSRDFARVLKDDLDRRRGRT
jgi:glycosyltransferase involved in cell wall biosynthesis